MVNRRYGLNVGDIISQKEYLEKFLAQLSNDTEATVIPVPTGNTSADGTPELELKFLSDILQTAKLQTIGSSGDFEDVSQQFGIGVRQHDDVELSYNHSRFTRLQQTIPSGDFLIIRLDVNGVNQHHVETRVLNVLGAPCQFTVVEVADTSEFPANPIQMPIWNNKGPVKETPGVDVLGEFNTYAIQQTNPLTATVDNIIDNAPIFAVEGSGPFGADVEGIFASVKGRHYTPNKTYAVIIENTGTQDTEIYYQYDWHEY